MVRETVDGFLMPPLLPNEPEGNLSNAEIGHAQKLTVSPTAWLVVKPMKRSGN